MLNVITESGMDFVSGNTFHIENSTLYKRLGVGVRSVEFIRAKGDKLLFVEAKTTFPDPCNPEPDNLKKFQTEIKEICEKFIHSLNLFSSVKVGVAEDEIDSDFIMPEKVSLVLVLVIKNHELGWCKPVRAKLIEILPSYLKKIWKPTVYVINHETAGKFSLTINETNDHKQKQQSTGG